MRPFGERIARSCEWLAVAAGWALLALALLVTFETFARKFFQFSIQGADEIGGYVLAISSAVGFCYGLVQRAHIRIDLLMPHLPKGVQAWLNILAFALLSGYAGLLAWRALAVFTESWQMKASAPTPLGTPLFLPQGVWALALVVLAVLAVFALLKAIVGVAARRMPEVARDFGPASLQDELEAELVDAGRRGVPAKAEA